MSWLLKLAEEKERKGAESGRYPENWEEIAQWVKTLANWRCERCGRAHELWGEKGFVLTVHHLNGDKWQCELWNLAALCQRCHLRIQNKVIWDRIPEEYNWLTLMYESVTEHSEWMARHIKAYNVYAWLNDKPLIPLTKIVKRDYSREWICE
jgi:hypothetical protein